MKSVAAQQIDNDIFQCRYFILNFVSRDMTSMSMSSRILSFFAVIHKNILCIFMMVYLHILDEPKNECPFSYFPPMLHVPVVRETTPLSPISFQFMPIHQKFIQRKLPIPLIFLKFIPHSTKSLDFIFKKALLTLTILSFSSSDLHLSESAASFRNFPFVFLFHFASWVLPEPPPPGARVDGQQLHQRVCAAGHPRAAGRRRPVPRPRAGGLRPLPPVHHPRRALPDGKG